MTYEWINSQIVFLIFHILGTVLGAGAAFTGDFIFITIVKNKIITNNELRIMRTTSKLVWFGLFVLLLSGIGLVLERPEIFLNSGKFWAKMTVIGVIVINGLLFATYHFKTLTRGADKKFSASNPIIKSRLWLVISGAVSVVSWNTVIVLGVLGRTPFSYIQFISIYLAFLCIAFLFAILINNKIIIFSSKKQT